MAPWRAVFLLQVVAASVPRGTRSGFHGNVSRLLQVKAKSANNCFEADCIVGSFLDNEGKCRACEPGYFTPQENMRQCLECDSGRFAHKAGTSLCISCPAGRFAPSPARTKCRDCRAGSYAPLPQAIECVPCEAGRFTSTNSNWTACLHCPAGRVTNRTGLTECDACKPGRATPDSESRQCQECDVGRYSDTFGASECTTCRSGRMQNKKGKTSCEDCGPWYWPPWPKSSTPDFSNCETDMEALAAIVVVFLSTLVLFNTLGKVFRYRIPLQDVKLEVSQSKGRLIIATHGPHHLVSCGCMWHPALSTAAPAAEVTLCFLGVADASHFAELSPCSTLPEW